MWGSWKRWLCSKQWFNSHYIYAVKFICNKNHVVCLYEFFPFLYKHFKHFKLALNFFKSQCSFHLYCSISCRYQGGKGSFVTALLNKLLRSVFFLILKIASTEKHFVRNLFKMPLLNCYQLNCYVDIIPLPWKQNYFNEMVSITCIHWTLYIPG